MIQNEIQWSNALNGEMVSKYGLRMFEEQQKELDSYKTKMEEYEDEKENLNRQMQEMRVSSGTGLLDLEHSTRTTIGIRF